MNNKKGLSDVVTTLIIILLVIVAVGILWVALRGLITKGTTQINNADFTTDLQIQKVTVNPNSVDVKVKLNQGTKIDGVLISISDGTNSQSFERMILFNAQEEKTLNVNYTGIVSKVSVYPIIINDQGQKSTGQIADTFKYINSTQTPTAQCSVNADCNSLNTNVTGCSGLNLIWTYNNYSCISGSCSATQTTGTLKSCDDGNISTSDSCSSGVCVNTPIPCQNGDGICPSGCTNSNDNDCAITYPMTGLVSWWKLNGNAIDFKGMNNGTVVGATVVTTGCKYGTGCYSFDGTVGDYITIASPGLVTPFTISVWVNPTSTASFRTIIGFDQQHRFLLNDSGFLLAQFNGSFYSNESLVVPNNAWTNVIYWFNGTTERWYINGVQSGFDHISTISSWNSAFKIGQYDLANYPYKGLIDEVMMYNRSLNSTEIIQLKNYFG